MIDFAASSSTIHVLLNVNTSCPRKLHALATVHDLSLLKTRSRSRRGTMDIVHKLKVPTLLFLPLFPLHSPLQLQTLHCSGIVPRGERIPMLCAGIMYPPPAPSAAAPGASVSGRCHPGLSAHIP